MNYEKVKNLILIVMLAALIVYTFRVSPLINLICVFALSICFWIQAFLYRKHTKEKNLITKNFLSIAWFIAAIYATVSLYYMITLI